MARTPHQHAPVPAPPTYFAATSPWNMSVAGLVADPNSAAMIANLAANWGKGLTINGADGFEEYSFPIYSVPVGTPLVRVDSTYGWWMGPASVPIPPGAQPSPGSDGHLLVIDPPGGVSHEFWELVTATSGWTAGAYTRYPLRGSGCQSGTWANGTRGSGVSGLGGLLLRAEIVAGSIPHALALAYPKTRGRAYVPPASHCDNSGASDRQSAANIPEGARLRLKASIDVAGRCGGNRAALAIGLALQRYGALMVDTAGACSLYAELPMGRWSWAGVLSAWVDARMWQAGDFEVLTLPPLVSAP